MTHPLIYVAGRSYEPAELEELKTIFDEVWTSLTSDGFGRGDSDIGAQRTRLATIVLELARDGQFGALEITRTASRLMREAEGASAGRR